MKTVGTYSTYGQSYLVFVNVMLTIFTRFFFMLTKIWLCLCYFMICNIVFRMPLLVMEEMSLDRRSKIIPVGLWLIFKIWLTVFENNNFISDNNVFINVIEGIRLCSFQQLLDTMFMSQKINGTHVRNRNFSWLYRTEERMGQISDQLEYCIRHLRDFDSAARSN